MGKEKLIPIIALLILLIGCTSTLYVHANQDTSQTLTINKQTYTINQLFLLTEPRTFVSIGFSGISLDDLIQNAGVTSPKTHEYTLIGADGYQKTVNWENMKNGLLTKDGQSIFSDLPKAFRVKDLRTIEVN